VKEMPAYSWPEFGLAQFMSKKAGGGGGGGGGPKGQNPRPTFELP